MKSSTKLNRNFHVPLPDDLYNRLRAESRRSKLPATKLARRALESWLKARRRVVLHEAIACYAPQCAGTSADLDPALEEASLECWLADEEAQQ